MNETYTGASLIKSTILAKSLHNEMPMSTTEIPQFYFPKGKPTDEKALINSINATIGDKTNEINN